MEADMTDSPADRRSPNEILASIIVEALTTAGLIKETNRLELLAKLEAGGVTQEDWQLWIDVATAQHAREEPEVDE
jgi:hypothetical protein